MICFEMCTACVNEKYLIGCAVHARNFHTNDMNEGKIELRAIFCNICIKLLLCKTTFLLILIRECGVVMRDIVLCNLVVF